MSLGQTVLMEFFYRSAWEIIEGDFFRAARYFFRHRFLPHGLNSNFVTLIPKFSGANRVEDFRPIVIGNFVYKALAKIVANRLGPILQVVLSPFQFGFIPGRSIHNCVAVASEGINCLDRTTVNGNMAIKVDIRKAFDTLKWDFIYFMLRKLGFHDNFLAMIEMILHSARIFILVNGSPHGYFACSQGVRQGDPLSPLLFCLAEEGLVGVLKAAAENASLQLAFARNGLRCPLILLYADDILIFCSACRANTRVIKSILQLYRRLSGLEFNAAKSKVFFGKHVFYNNMRYFRNTLGIAIGVFPFVYLWVPIFKGAPKVCHLRPIADKILAHFATWKGTALSMAGRVCLVNSVIMSSLVNSMIVYKWPRSLLGSMEQAMRNFIWSGSIDKRGFCTISWYKVCAPRAEGGLGVRSLRWANEAYLTKLAWSIVCHHRIQL